MTTVIFYEKAGCINNTKQKALLKAAGHRVIARNLLLESWTRDRLRPFFGDLPVAQWFNTTAPAITNGLIVPQDLTADIALDLMVLDPILIRRPLMKVGQQCRVGFEPKAIDQWIGLAMPGGVAEDLETCPRQPTGTQLRGGATLV